MSTNINIDEQAVFGGLNKSSEAAILVISACSMSMQAHRDYDMVLIQLAFTLVSRGRDGCAATRRYRQV